MIQRSILILGLGLSALLLGKFAVDFMAQYRVLGVPFALLVLATAIVGASNLFRRSSIAGHESVAQNRGKPAWEAAGRLLLIAAVPLGFLASSLDCTGLSLSGCSSFCTLVKDIWIPMIALGAISYLITRSRGVLLSMSAMSCLPLVHHCLR